jgi:2-polyprenyl-6-methoxyphenol hydroxylase-like FAD-dependent oxidoreductase
MLNADDVATRVPIDVAGWTRSFPHLAGLIARFGAQGHYAPFEWIRLHRWSAGRVAVLGDAAHALPPNIGQGAGCAMMNALSLAVHLDGAADIPAALAAWEARERPITEHTQRVSVWLGVPTTWPPALRNLTFRLIGKSKWLVRQRIKTALHRPTGTPGACV